MHPFTPAGSTVKVAATTSSLSATFGTSARTVRVHNAGSGVVFIEFGGSTVAATTTTSMPMAAGSVEVFSVGGQATYLAAITASGTADVYVTPGDGI